MKENKNKYEKLIEINSSDESSPYKFIKIKQNYKNIKHS